MSLSYRLEFSIPIAIFTNIPDFVCVRSDLLDAKIYSTLYAYDIGYQFILSVYG